MKKATGNRRMKKNSNLFFVATTVMAIGLVAKPLDAQQELPLDPPSIELSDVDAPGRPVLDLQLAQQVAPLIEQLDKGTPQEQAEAEEGLTKLGPAILAHLPRLPSSVTGTYRDALDRIRDSLQSKAIGEYAEPSTVTLKGKLPAGDVLLEIIEQTDNQLTIEQIPARVECEF